MFFTHNRFPVKHCKQERFAPLSAGNALAVGHKALAAGFRPIPTPYALPEKKRWRYADKAKAHKEQVVSKYFVKKVPRRTGGPS